MSAAAAPQGTRTWQQRRRQQHLPLLQPQRTLQQTVTLGLGIQHRQGGGWSQQALAAAGGYTAGTHSLLRYSSVVRIRALGGVLALGQEHGDTHSNSRGVVVVRVRSSAVDTARGRSGPPVVDLVRTQFGTWCSRARTPTDRCWCSWTHPCAWHNCTQSRTWLCSSKLSQRCACSCAHMHPGGRTLDQISVQGWGLLSCRALSFLQVLLQ